MWATSFKTTQVTLQPDLTRIESGLSLQTPDEVGVVRDHLSVQVKWMYEEIPSLCMCKP